MHADDYYSIKSEGTAELIVKGSRFIAHACPVGTKEEAEAVIRKIAAKFHDATHNCFAYKIGTGDQADFRFSDDGEPSGTAGKPIFQAIETKDLTNLAVVVTRYFGGTKLGTGGLIRAYSGVALQALNSATVIKHFVKGNLRLEFDYEFTNPVHHYLNKFHADILDSTFDVKTTYIVSLKRRDEDAFKKELLNASSGRINIKSQSFDD